MYACLHMPSVSDAASVALFELANLFSPVVEVTAPGTVVFSIQGLRKLIGTLHQVASEIARRGAERGIIANLAIAANPDSAVLAASHLSGVTILSPGQEAVRLGAIPLERIPMPPELLETFDRWGLKTLGDVSALPPIGLVERLGETGLALYELALGQAHRPLHVTLPLASYSERIELEDPVAQLEPLLFLIARMLGELCGRLESQSMATNRITARLTLEDGSEHTRILELPIPQKETRPLLKLLQLDLEAHPPGASVTAIALSLQPVEPRKLQGGLFLPPAPEPEKLQVTLARISAMVGEGNVGSPELLDTHRPDAFRIRPFALSVVKAGQREESGFACLSLRIFRPALPAKVRLNSRGPRHVAAPGVRGKVLEAAGPWRSSGDWWTCMYWARDEWDVALADNGLYRIFNDLDSREWYVEGVYD
jgi:protein ImuB